MRMRVEVDNEHLVVEVHPGERVVVVRRKATRPETVAELEAAFTEAVSIAGDYRGWGLLIDSRLAPGRSDEEFEQRVTRLRARVDPIFSRVVMLLGTAVGVLQAQRLQSERRSESPNAAETLFTRDPDEAMRLAAGA